MDLKAKSREISESLVKLKEELHQTKETIQQEMEMNLHELKDASSKGDRSENAAFTAATEKAQDLTIQLANVEKLLNDIENMKKEEKYRNIGMVVYYTTVLLYVPAKNRRFVLKLYPNGVSDIGKGILARNCAVGKAIWQKHKGDEVFVIDKCTGEDLKYIIEDFY
jgi:transcription elongation GreA/GreB family factor